MDLQDFECSSMYFNDPMSSEVERLLHTASEFYGTEKAEASLLRAYFLESGNLAVHVALYRYYYYQHEYEKALKVADSAMRVAGTKLGLPEKWRDINTSYLGSAALISMGLLRFYLLSLKGTGYLNLRLGRVNVGLEILQKLSELDPHDRLHVKFLLDMAQEKANITNNDNVISFSGYNSFSAAAK